MGKESKYNYGGMTLYKYCKENQLEYSLIVRSIDRLKESGVCDNYSDDRIVKIVVEKYISNMDKKYYGFSLFQFCKNNNLNYTLTANRIRKLRQKEENKDKTNHELLEMAIDSNFVVPKNPYYYKGELLQDYCKKNGIDLKYISNRIAKIKEKYPEQDEEEIIALALDVNYVINRKVYFYNGETLVEYCKKHNLSHPIILDRIIRHKKKYGDLMQEKDIIELAISAPQNPNYHSTQDVKYYYKGESLSSYCQKNHIHYSGIRYRINIIKEMYPEYDDQKVVDLAMDKSFVLKQKRIMYKGQFLMDYCRENNINYSYVRQLVKSYTDQETDREILIERAISELKENEKIRNLNSKIREYCKENNLQFQTVGKKIRELKKDENYQGLSDEELLEIVKNSYQSRPPKIYKGESLKDYCLKNNLMYEQVSDKLRKYKTKEKYQGLSEEELLDIIIPRSKETRRLYSYNGQSLLSYCKSEGLDYSTIIKSIKENPVIDQRVIDTIVEAALARKKKRYEQIDEYMYEGTSLKEYCLQNELSIELVRNRIQALKKDVNFKNANLNVLIATALSKDDKKHR